jgi:hypothetical protein
MDQLLERLRAKAHEEGFASVRIAAPTATIVEALLAGSRRLHPAVTMLDGELGIRSRAGLLSLELGRRRVLARHVPSLSPLERTEVINSFSN